MTKRMMAVLQESERLLRDLECERSYSKQLLKRIAGLRGEITRMKQLRHKRRPM